MAEMVGFVAQELSLGKLLAFKVKRCVRGDRYHPLSVFAYTMGILCMHPHPSSYRQGGRLDFPS